MHLDGSIQVASFVEDQIDSFVEIARHPCSPSVTSNGRCLLVIGTDGKARIVKGCLLS